MQAKEGAGTKGGLGRWDLCSIDCSGVPPSSSHSPQFGGAAAPSLPQADGVWGVSAPSSLWGWAAGVG